MASALEQAIKTIQVNDYMAGMAVDLDTNSFMIQLTVLTAVTLTVAGYDYGM